MKKIIMIGMAAIMIFTMAGCESLERAKKDLSSEYGGGLERTVEVINIEGKVIKKYEGKFDIIADESKIKFIKDGKVHQIYRSETDIIIVEEK